MKTYRSNVGIAVLNAKGEIFVGKRIYAGQTAHITQKPWQMPQGGIDDGEDALGAAVRELYEETGMTKISFLFAAQNLYYYDFPYDLKLQSRMEKFLGQAQQWYFFRYEGNDDELAQNFTAVAEKEFEDWRWVQKQDVLNNVIYFKSQLYALVLSHFDYAI